MRFSERIGKKKIKCDLQIESMDADLRNSLWNILWEYVIGEIREWKDTCVDTLWHDFVTNLWHEFFKHPIDEIPWAIASQVQTEIKDWFFKSQWYEVYDLLEFLMQLRLPISRKEFRDECNRVLERELSGYRIVGNKIAPITNKIETREIEQVFETTLEHKLKGVHKHLESAVEKLSDRKNPDYRNSIKESISAVESLCIIISNKPKATLGQALKKIENSVGLHAALKSGFSSIYGYTSNEGGIRHAMIDESACGFDDAKYMLVSCSAFVNYLVMKATKARIIK